MNQRELTLPFQLSSHQKIFDFSLLTSFFSETAEKKKKKLLLFFLFWLAVVAPGGLCGPRFGLETGQTQSLLDLISTLSARHHDTVVTLFLNFSSDHHAAQRSLRDFSHFLEDRRSALSETEAGLTSAKHDLLSGYHSELDRVLARTEPKNARNLLATLSASARALLAAARAERDRGYRVDMVRIGAVPDESDYNLVFQRGSLVDVWAELLTVIEQKRRSVSFDEEGDSSRSLSSEGLAPHRGAPRPVYVAPQEPPPASLAAAVLGAVLDRGWAITLVVLSLAGLAVLARKCLSGGKNEWTKFKRTAAKQALILPSHWRDEGFVHHTD
jgi:hypothetical protein